ncbi:NmrA/HSCARG family protein [Terrimonas pollutisoli]|uniref:NmrA/HSCARG family protein n=1 Tax=Terrimonas pollutisoli TaxID=3034147 RepID=UPI0023EC42C1|nr:NmrA/HSCARG family protein [Terrimonas sp. H1YJ31]
MDTGKTIFVTGATGKQGGAAIKHLLQRGFAIKAFTRNKESKAAQLLRQPNVEIIEGNLDEPSTYTDHLDNIHGIFAVLDFKQGPTKETEQGFDLIIAAKEKSIAHFLYSSVIGADANTGIPHWESKNKIENLLKQSGVHHTIIRPCYFMENFLLPQVKSRLLKGKLVMPLHKKKVQQYMSTEDVGRIAAIIFSESQSYMDKTITLASEQMDGITLAEHFSTAFNKPVKYQQLPGVITRLVMGRDLYKMFNWINQHDAVFVKDLDALKRDFPGMLSLDEWIKQKFN